MKNTKYYPFERNNYFYGKLLTVRDFHEEQKYVNDKRRFNNFFTKGVGVVAGLDVVLIDEKTISISAGMALDSQGREIIVEESVIKKLNVIEGFSQLQNFDDVYICISYDEAGKEPVHAVTGTAVDNFNRIEENYSLNLLDELPAENLCWLNSLKYTYTVIYDDKGLKVTQKTPKYAMPNEQLSVTLLVENKGVLNSVEIDYLLHCEYMEGSDNAVRIYFAGDLNSYQKSEHTFYGKIKDISIEKENITFLCKEGRVSVAGEKIELNRVEPINVSLENEDVNRRIVDAYFKTHIEDTMSRNLEHTICIAKLQIIKRADDFSILNVEKIPFEQYVLSNQMLYMLLNNSLDKSFAKSRSSAEENTVSQLPSAKQNVMTGNENIYIDTNSKGKVYYSDEIAHGLGKGKVYIDVAIDEKTDTNLIYEQSSVIFGDMSILENTIFESTLPAVKTAVVSYPEKGTFRIVVKVLENAEVTSLDLCWWAIDNDIIRNRDHSEMNEVSVSVTPNTVTIAPKEKIKLNAQIFGTDSQECRFTVVEDDGGQINIHGLYEAPTKEGIYEVIVESVQYPNKKATAYIVVKKN